jgi:D-arginine utilization repressor
MNDFERIAHSIVALFEPLAEVVIHDIESDAIVYIEGSLSKRRVGDPSLLSPDELDPKKLDGNYAKLNFDGRLIKSISTLFKNPTTGKNQMMCINLDMSAFESLHTITSSLLQISSPQPDALFVNDWQERVNVAISSYLSERTIKFEQLRPNDKKHLIKSLFDHGAFNEKKAADYISSALGVGRATIFNYLKEWRKA